MSQAIWSRALFLFFLGAASFYAPNALATNGNYCRFNNQTTLLLVDRTTAYDQQDRQVFARGMSLLYSRLEVGERLVVRTITSEYAASLVEFEGCKPGCRAEDVGLLGACNPLVATRDERAFRTLYLRAARNIVNTSSNLRRSEIMMTVATTTPHYMRSGLHRLLIFSDLLENSTTVPWPRLLRMEPTVFTQQAAAADGVPNLRGVAVSVFGFGRDHTPARHSLAPSDRRQVLSAWAAYFAAAETSATIEQELQ